MIYWVFRRIDWREAQRLVMQLPLWSPVVAALFFNLSQVLSVYRTNLFYRSLGIRMRWWTQLKLYYLGMFYNLFIPGGIGGDAYKVFWLQKRYKARTRSLVQVSLTDRLSGLVGILLWLGVFFWLTPWAGQWKVSVPAAAVWLLCVPVLAWGVRRLLSAGYPVVWQAVLPSVGIQFAQLLCIAALLWGWGVREGLFLYGFVFLLSSIVTVIPVTIGGVGAREFTFLTFAPLLGIAPSVSVTVALLFFLLTAVSSLPGGLVRL